MKNKKGFTLIELLAIIVILAIIAVITVPIILNIIDNSKKGAAADSAYGYKDAIRTAYIGKLSADSDYNIENGTYTVSDLKTLIDVSTSGKEPASNSWVEIEKNNVVSGCLQYDEYKVEISDGKVSNTEKGECLGSSSGIDVAAIIETLGAVEKSDGAYYIPSTNSGGVSIFFNPDPAEGTSGILCDSSDSVGTTGTATGCMHWYLYSIKGNYVNMILDHNISQAGSSEGSWASEDDYKAGLTPIMDGEAVVGYQIGEGTGSKATSAGITYPNTVTSFPAYGSDSGQSKNARGPVTALNYLKTNTENWKTGVPKVPNLSGIEENIISFSSNDNKFKIDYTGYHARLLTYDEMSNLGCTSSSMSCPLWMVSHTFAQSTSVFANIMGYWTSSPKGNSSTHVWDYSCYSNNFSNDYASNTYGGVRPVITVNIAEIADQLS